MPVTNTPPVHVEDLIRRQLFPNDTSLKHVPHVGIKSLIFVPRQLRVFKLLRSFPSPHRLNVIIRMAVVGNGEVVHVERTSTLWVDSTSSSQSY